MAGTFYINSAMVGSSSYYMTWSQIHDLHDAGNEIGGHTLHHVNLTEVDSATAATEVCEDRRALRAQGLGAVASFAYPEGGVDAAVEATVKGCGYASGRAVGGVPSSGCPCPYAETIPPRDPYRLQTADGATSSTTLASLQASVTNAETHGGGWVSLVFHGICDDSCTSANTVSVATFTAFLDWLHGRSANGTVVRTVDDVMDTGEVAPPPPRPVTSISCNGSPCSSGWYRTAPVTVRLSASGSRATTWFTTDGSDPTDIGGGRQRYDGPIALHESTTVRFFSESARGGTEVPRSKSVKIRTAASALTRTVPRGGASTSSTPGLVDLANDAVDLSAVAGRWALVWYADGVIVRWSELLGL
jgi:peptidoglycan/xylan/chitin deacetylase (PgdA/CDA1 family)